MDDSARISALEIKIAELERRLNYFAEQLRLAYPAEPVNPALADATNWLKKGNKLEAVKSYQKLAGVGLKEAKEVVDALDLKLKAGG